MKHVARWCAVVLLVSVSLVGGPSVASAAPPDNDDAAAAVVISQLPFIDTRDVTEATPHPADPLGCFGEDTVWYRFTPTETIRLALDTFGSRFDTVLSVYTGTPGDLTYLHCSDSDLDEFGASAMYFTAEAGTEYFIQVGSCCTYPDGGGPPGQGGHLQLNAYVAPPFTDVTLTVDTHQTVDREGVVTLTGTIACNNVSWALVVVESLTQRSGASTRTTPGDRPSVSVERCGPEPTAWSVEVVSSTDRRFRPPRALATVHATACDPFSCTGESETSEVRLRRR